MNETNAQTLRSVQVQSVYWLRYTQQWQIAKKWQFQNEVDTRRLFSPHRHLTSLVRAQVIHQFAPQWQVGLGMGYFWQSANDRHSQNRLLTPEIRPQLEFAHHQGRGRWQWHHFYRVDFRFIHNAEGESLQPGYHFNFRFRYRFLLEYALWQKMEKKTALRVRASNEILLNGGKQIVQNIFDQNRAALGFFYQRPIWFAELSYLNWYQQINGGPNFYNRHIIRLFLGHSFDLQKKQTPRMESRQNGR